jgi:hypothetical protein
MFDFSMSDYVYQRESTPASIDPPKFKIKKGLDGLYYAVFKSEWDWYEFDLLYPHYFKDCTLSCFNGYYNAVCIGRLQ